MEPFSPAEPGLPAGKSPPVPRRTRHVLVGVTGSVAALKLPLLVDELLKIHGVSKEKVPSGFEPLEICWVLGYENAVQLSLSNSPHNDGKPERETAIQAALRVCALFFNSSLRSGVTSRGHS